MLDYENCSSRLYKMCTTKREKTGYVEVVHNMYVCCVV